MSEERTKFIVQLSSNLVNGGDGCKYTRKNEFEKFIFGPLTQEERERIKNHCLIRYSKKFGIDKEKITEAMLLALYPTLGSYIGIWTHDILNGAGSSENYINADKRIVKKIVDEIYAFNITKLNLDGSIGTKFWKKYSELEEWEFDYFLSLMQVPVENKHKDIPELLSSIEAHFLRKAQPNNIQPYDTTNHVVKLHSTIEDKRKNGNWDLLTNEFEELILGFLTTEEKKRFKDICYGGEADFGTSKTTCYESYYNTDKESIIRAMDSILYGRLYKYRGYSVDEILNGTKSRDIVEKAKKQIDEYVENIYEYNINFLDGFKIFKADFGEKNSKCTEERFDKCLLYMQVPVFSKNIPIDKLLSSTQAYISGEFTSGDNTRDI